MQFGAKMARLVVMLASGARQTMHFISLVLVLHRAGTIIFLLAVPPTVINLFKQHPRQSKSSFYYSPRGTAGVRRSFPSFYHDLQTNTFGFRLYFG